MRDPTLLANRTAKWIVTSRPLETAQLLAGTTDVHQIAPKLRQFFDESVAYGKTLVIDNPQHRPAEPAVELSNIALEELNWLEVAGFVISHYANSENPHSEITP